MLHTSMVPTRGSRRPSYLLLIIHWECRVVGLLQQLQQQQHWFINMYISNITCNWDYIHLYILPFIVICLLFFATNTNEVFWPFLSSLYLPKYSWLVCSLFIPFVFHLWRINNTAQMPKFNLFRRYVNSFLYEIPCQIIPLFNFSIKYIMFARHEMNDG